MRVAPQMPPPQIPRPGAATANNKSPGPHKIGMRVIKDCLPVILSPLTHIIYSSLITSIFSEEWKLSEVTPLHKDGEQEVA